jgi:hypothetical protein
MTESWQGNGTEGARVTPATPLRGGEALRTPSRGAGASSRLETFFSGARSIGSTPARAAHARVEPETLLKLQPIESLLAPTPSGSADRKRRRARQGSPMLGFYPMNTLTRKPTTPTRLTPNGKLASVSALRPANIRAPGLFVSQASQPELSVDVDAVAHAAVCSPAANARVRKRPKRLDLLGARPALDS